MPIVDESRKQPYSDTPKPRVFGAASPFDPQLFATVNEGPASAKIPQTEVAQWLRTLADRAREHMARVPARKTAEYRRWQLDVTILSGLGQFFAGKISAATSWREFERTGSQEDLQRAVAHYTRVRDEWAALAKAAKGPYADDITYGTARHMRGHWMDRLADIEGDLEDMKKRLVVGLAKVQAEGDASHPTFRHTPPVSFQPGKDLEIVVSGAAASLYYRHVNQAERWLSVQAEARGDKTYRAIIPAAYTRSRFDLQYYFQMGGKLAPGFGPDHAGTPYYVVRPA